MEKYIHISVAFYKLEYSKNMRKKVASSPSITVDNDDDDDDGDDDDEALSPAKS